MENNSVLDQNMDKTLVSKKGTQRKPRGVSGYEYDFNWTGEPSFGRSFYLSILKGFSSVFEYNNLPKDFNTSVFELFLLQTGRMKVIKVGSKILPVHIVPLKFDHYGNWIESSIIEPYLPKLSGIKAEIFPNVQFKNDVIGQSIISLIYPFIETIDEAFFNLDINMRVISGKFVGLVDEITTTENNNEEENAINQWMINGKPYKGMKKSLISDDGIPIFKLSVDDYTTSFIETIRYNMSQALNVLGIPNDNLENKKERKITSEISVQNILQSSIIEDMWNERKKSVKELNAIMNLNVIVKVKEAYKNIEVQEEINNDNEGVNDE